MVPVWLPDLELSVKYHRGKGEEGFSSMWCLAGFSAHSPVVIGPCLQTTAWSGSRGCMGQGRLGGWMPDGTMDPWVAFWCF